MRVENRREIAEGIVLLELVSESGANLPAFTAGSHIDLHLPGGMVRSYSLADAASGRERYVIAVGRDAASRGGSIYVHDRLRTGDRIDISLPRNNFALAGAAAPSVLIAGGIGITPIHAMAQTLAAARQPWMLYYSVRSRARGAFLEELAALSRTGGAEMTLHVDEEAAGRFLDIGAIVAAAPPEAHFYCCGPQPMLDAFERAVAGIPPERVHLERFSASQEAALDGGFTVELASTGETFLIEPGRSILDTLLDNGIDVPFSCSEGTCGTCETRVIEGVPDHRDAFLTHQERAANKTMMICCSGAKSSRLKLGL